MHRLPLRFLRSLAGSTVLVLFAAILAARETTGLTTARRGMVSAEQALAARAGAEILALGGNAVDAAVASAFAMGVLNPTSCGIGGGGFLLYFDSAKHRLHALDFRETAPAAATRDMYLRGGKVDPDASLHGGLAVATPGEVRGLTLAVEQLGRLDRRRVLGPAIRYAGDGFPVGKHLASEIAAHTAEIRRAPDLAAIYLKADGEPYREGEKLVQADLAKTLRMVAEGGPSAFYAGPIAERIARAVSHAGGILSTSDLRTYEARWREALETPYRGYRVAGFPPPSSGGGVLLEALNVLSGFDLRAEPRESPQNLRRIADTMKLVFADRARDYGDPDFVRVPLARLLSRAHAAELRARISSGRSPAAGAAASGGRGGTSHLSVMDGQGNAAALTHTINTSFGSMVVVPGTGIVLNNEMDDFSAAPGVPNVYGLVGTEANSIRPGKRPLSSMSPTIVLRGEQAELALGASGGPRIITATLLVTLNVLDFSLALDEAIRAPRIHHQWRPDVLFFERGIDGRALEALRAQGQTLTEVPELAAVQAVARGPRGLFGFADPRKGGGAAGF
ncbi:MAG: gamma-glutamyltranspeptidase / glutathione hydrolase [Candidatus Binatota bacterium]|nr:gamma-glutamyltranspeptidase / glutathione hydrolase [Candidatus Binatota bacterium]